MTLEVPLRAACPATQTAPQPVALLPPGAKVLLPLDFSQVARPAVDTVLRLAESRPDVRLCFVHVVDEGRQEPLAGRLRDAARQMDSLLSGLHTTASVESAVVRGSPAQTLCALGRGGFSLMVVTSHGSSGLAPMIMGSVAETLVEEALISTLVIKPRLDDAGCMQPVVPTFRHLIVGWNGSAGCAKALGTAHSLASRFGGRLTLVQAVPPGASPPQDAFEALLAQEVALERASRGLQDMCRLCTPESAHWTAKAVIGGPCEVLMHEVRSVAGDLIIVGPHEATRWGHALGESCIGHMARSAPCAVLIVR